MNTDEQSCRALRRDDFHHVGEWRKHPDDSMPRPQNWGPPHYWTYQVRSATPGGCP